MSSKIKGDVFEVPGFQLSQGFPPNEVFVDDRGRTTTPWKELLRLFCIWTSDYYDGEDDYDTRPKRSLLRAIRQFIEHGAELENVPPTIKSMTMEEFIDGRFNYFLCDDSDADTAGKLAVEQLKNEILAAIADRRRIMAAEVLASLTASAQDKETVPQLDGSLNAQVDKEMDDNGNKADAGRDPKSNTGRKVNLKAVQDALCWVLLFGILAISIYMKPDLMKQADS